MEIGASIVFKGIMDSIACAITGRKAVQFQTSATPPYSVIQYLEGVGVIVWPGQVSIVGNAALCNILVKPKQYKYAAALVAGRPDCTLVSPRGIKPIRPRRSWGKPTRSRGIFSAICRSVAGAGTEWRPVQQFAVKGRHK